MKRFSNDLNIYFRTCFYCLCFLALGLCACGWLFGRDNGGQYPLGLIVGVGVAILLFFINGLFFNSENPEKGATISIIFIFVRLLVLVGSAIGFSYLYYKANITVINVFTFFGGYFVCLLIFIIVCAIDRKSKNK